jgi:hypothetical protein
MTLPGSQAAKIMQEDIKVKYYAYRGLQDFFWISGIYVNRV